MEDQPQVFIQVLRDCNALKTLMPEVNALFGVPQPEAHHPEIDTGIHTLSVLEQAALHQQPLTVRWACLLHDLGKGLTPVDKLPQHIAHEHTGLKLIKAVNERFKVPKDCQELALLVGQYHTHGHRALELKASTLLELLQSFDVYRRPQRFEEFVVSCEMDARGRKGLSREVIHRRIIYAAQPRPLAKYRWRPCWRKVSKARSWARRSSVSDSRCSKPTKSNTTCSRYSLWQTGLHQCRSVKRKTCGSGLAREDIGTVNIDAD